MRISAFVPAKGFSQRLPRKNMRTLGDEPLVARAIRTIQEALDLAEIAGQVYVITDSPEIRWVSERAGAAVIDHPPYDPSTTVGETVNHAAAQIGWTGPTLIVQPTCATLTADTLTRALVEWEMSLDSSEPLECVVGAVDDTHIRWDDSGLITGRVNNLPKAWRETGWFLTTRWPAKGSTASTGPQIGYPCKLWEVSPAEAVDVDEHCGLASARVFNARRSILITCSGAVGTGSGHVRRQLALADQLDHHFVQFDGRGLEGWALDLIEEAGYPLAQGCPEVDLQIVDHAEPDLRMLVGARYGHVAFEDLGPVSATSRLVVNAMIRDGRPHALSGPSWEVLASAWAMGGRAAPEAGERGMVTITFGGTDPELATELAVRAALSVAPGKCLQVVIPPNAQREIHVADPRVEQLHQPFMPAVLAGSKLVISSAGRTMIECAAVGAPTLAFPVNERECGRLHPGNVISPGPMWSMNQEAIAHSIQWLLSHDELRERLSKAGLAQVDGKGAARVAHAIEGLFL